MAMVVVGITIAADTGPEMTENLLGKGTWNDRRNEENYAQRTSYPRAQRVTEGKSTRGGGGGLEQRAVKGEDKTSTVEKLRTRPRPCRKQGPNTGSSDPPVYISGAMRSAFHHQKDTEYLQIK